MYSKLMYGMGNQQSPIRELFEFGMRQAAKIGAENVFDFTLGNPSVPTPQAVTDAWLDLLQTVPPSQLHAYTVGIGRFETRKAIADHLNARFGCSCDASQLFISCGAAAALTSSIKALTLAHDSEFIAMAPYFTEYEAYVRGSGARFVSIEASEDFRLNLPALERAINEKTQAVIVNSPNNPGGKVYSREELTDLAGLLRQKEQSLGHPIYLISDEPYRELVYGGVDVPFIPMIYANTIVCYSYSKIFSIPGERIGYVYVPAEAEDGAEIYKAVAGAARAQGYVCAPSLLQRVIERCVDVQPDLEPYLRNRSLLYDSLVQQGYHCVQPDGAFYLFVKAPGGDAEAFSRRAKELNVLVVPGTGFGCKDYVRVSYCVPEERIRRALPLFAQLREKN